MSTDLPPLPDDATRVLAVAAHPDDLEYGTAAAVARWTAEGKDVSYLLVTRGEAGIHDLPPAKAAVVREDEERRSAAAVGVRDVRFLDDHRDGVVVEGPALRRDIAREIRRVRPELVVVNSHHETFGPGLWNSADHRAVGRATIDAVGDAGNRWIFPELVDEGFEPWPGVRHVAVAASTQPTHVVDVTGYREAAIASLAEHATYLAALDPRPVAEQAREVVVMTTGGDGPPRVAFEVFG
ncbi:PIG-L deacetylase family protein [Actinomycetospora lemnae]|uniref:PIG-L family deacetylase n=1 Tax=Actinomycetospora lemnae TaxID=3019891 RepID=A0ABT5SW81_9PSEU|nr:PIG-L deacetylase family protein [Actinomycetospora sp. DW7H6]MDD7966981.1 PIG-L family deacetylase [Actinomycetospora sp. DW7H6]